MSNQDDERTVSRRTVLRSTAAAGAAGVAATGFSASAGARSGVREVDLDVDADSLSMETLRANGLVNGDGATETGQQLLDRLTEETPVRADSVSELLRVADDVRTVRDADGGVELSLIVESDHGRLQFAFDENTAPFAAFRGVDGEGSVVLARSASGSYEVLNENEDGVRPDFCGNCWCSGECGLWRHKELEYCTYESGGDCDITGSCGC